MAATAVAGAETAISGLWISKDSSAISMGEAKDVQLERTGDGELTAHNDVVVDGDLTTGGDAACAGDLIVGGSGAFTGDVTISGHLEVDNHISTGCVECC